MKLMKIAMLCAVLILQASSTYAAVRSVKGLWVTTTDDHLYWLRLQTSTDSGGMVEDLSGSITVGSVGGSHETTSETPVTGQYLVRTGIVLLNLGKPGANREYAIGDTRAEGRHMSLRVFKLRPGQDLDFERELLLDPKSEAHTP